jgi:hypothetical protein
VVQEKGRRPEEYFRKMDVQGGRETGMINLQKPSVLKGLVARMLASLRRRMKNP